MKKKFYKDKLFLLVSLIFIFLQSCETITKFPNKVIETGSDAVEYVGSIFSGDEKEAMISEDEENEGIISAVPQSKIQLEEDVQLLNNDVERDSENKNNDSSLQDAKQVLKAVPAEDYQINNVVANNIKDEKNVMKPLDSIKKESKDDNKQIAVDLLTKKSLILENKVQFKIATINFRSGSSSIGGKDILKIKKVIKLAKEKNARVRIVGHASTRTKDMPPLNHKLANFNISDKRSQAVAQVFLKNKFPSSMLITEAVSDSKPLFHESMPAGTYGNQRTEIFIIY